MEERWGPGEGWVSDSIGKVSEESVGHLSEKHEVTIKQDRIESKYLHVYQGEVAIGGTGGPGLLGGSG